MQTEPENLSAMIPLLWEMGNLKRIKPAHLPFSLATDLFQRAWGEIGSGADVRRVALTITAGAVAAAELGAIDQTILTQSGLSKSDIENVLTRAFDSSAHLIDSQLSRLLRQNLSVGSEPVLVEAPDFVRKLSRQPRSGATKPGASRLIFDAPENHAEHSIIVGIYGVLLAPVFEADIETVFLTALSHHFHNAFLPDAGFAGEELLGEFLPRIFQTLREKCLSQLSKDVSELARQTFIVTENALSPESKAFHAADVIDRLLQMRHHHQVNQFNLKYALEEMELVHAGNVQAFHYEILRRAKLIG